MSGPLVSLVLATHNAHKVTELRQILGAQLDGIDLMVYDGPEPVEDGDSFEANALIKARAASAHTGFAAIADDSGIVVATLGGAPGINSARYAGTRDDADNVRLLLTNLQGADDEDLRGECRAVGLLVSLRAGEIAVRNQPGLLEALEQALGNRHVARSTVDDEGRVDRPADDRRNHQHAVLAAQVNFERAVRGRR